MFKYITSKQISDFVSHNKPNTHQVLTQNANEIHSQTAQTLTWKKKETNDYYHESNGPLRQSSLNDFSTNPKACVTDSIKVEPAACEKDRGNGYTCAHSGCPAV